MKRETPSKRGRPSKPLLERLRVIVWSHHVMAATGALQAVQFEKLISKSHPNIHLSSGLWPRYMRGDVMPQGSPEKHKASLVSRLESFRPGTAEIFYHPVWTLFDFDHLLGPRQLRDLYMTMNRSVWENFAYFGHKDDGTLRTEATLFWKSPTMPEDLGEKLAAVKGIDGVAVCLIEARMAYLAQYLDDCAGALLGAYAHLHTLAKASEFQPPKAASALMLLKAMLLNFAGSLFVDPGCREQCDKQLLRIFTHRQSEWTRHAEAHRDSLGKPAAVLFAKQVKQIQSATFAW